MPQENRWTIYRTRFLVRARQLTQPLIFTDPLGREQSGQAGDYLVESSDGLRRIIRRALFEDIYVALEPNAQSKDVQNKNAEPHVDGGPAVPARPVARVAPQTSARVSA